jgi:hypothetical protein
MIIENDSTMYDKNLEFNNSERELVLSKLSESIDYLHHKCLKGNVRNEPKEKVRIQWFKALSYTCSIYNQISRDNEIDALKMELDEIKKILEDDKK